MGRQRKSKEHIGICQLQKRHFPEKKTIGQFKADIL